MARFLIAASGWTRPNGGAQRAVSQWRRDPLNPIPFGKKASYDQLWHPRGVWASES